MAMGERYAYNQFPPQFLPVLRFWNSNLNSLTTKFDYVPTVLGTYNFQCNIHPTTMMGSFHCSYAPQQSVSISANGLPPFANPGSVYSFVSESSGGPFTYQWKKGMNKYKRGNQSTLLVKASGSYKLVCYQCLRKHCYFQCHFRNLRIPLPQLTLPRAPA
jgi:plastocyanin